MALGGKRRPQLRLVAPVDATTRTEQWLQRIVVGLGLCPFARPVLDNELLEIVVSDARDLDTLTADLDQALERLATTPAETLDTTLIVIESLLDDFAAFNDYLAVADAVLQARDLDGVIQNASFHPAYVFDGADPADAANATNRAPYPTLHLLRESSLDAAIERYGDTSVIPERNAARLRALGLAAYSDLMAD